MIGKSIHMWVSSDLTPHRDETCGSENPSDHRVHVRCYVDFVKGKMSYRFKAPLLTMYNITRLRTRLDLLGHLH